MFFLYFAHKDTKCRVKNLVNKKKPSFYYFLQLFLLIKTLRLPHSLLPENVCVTFCQKTRSKRNEKRVQVHEKNCCLAIETRSA